MLENMENYTGDGQNTRQQIANPMVFNPYMKSTSCSDDIEVIDLDNARGQIKPTTWH